MPALVALALALPACGESGTNAPGLGDQRMTASIDSIAWKPSAAAATYARGMLNIISSLQLGNGEREALEITLLNARAPGTYSLTSIQGNSAHVRRRSVDYLIPITSLESRGSITITRLDTSSTAGRVAGTFAFTLFKDSDHTSTDSVVVTEGSFDLKIIQ